MGDKIFSCHCCEKDENDNWVHEPCSSHGYCESDSTDEKDMIGYCIHCGGEMFKEEGFWYHHSQSDTPVEERLNHQFGI